MDKKQKKWFDQYAIFFYTSYPELLFVIIIVIMALNDIT